MTANPAISYRSIAVSGIRGIGPKYASILRDKGLISYFDLFLHLPFRYEDKTTVTKIRDLKDGTPALIEGVVKASEVKPKFFKVIILDDSNETIELIYFNYWEGLVKRFSPGDRIAAYGTVRMAWYYGQHSKSMAQPEIKHLKAHENAAMEDTLTPVYHLTSGIKQYVMRRTVDEALKFLKLHPMHELIPAELNPFNITLTEAILECHHPKPKLLEDNSDFAKQPCFLRIFFEEIVSYQISLMSLRARSAKIAPCSLSEDPLITSRIIAALPFSPTAAQLKSYQEILNDLSGKRPMLRLLQGDVGSGKTLVALMAAAQAALQGWQCALMAPTELLARQHFINAKALLEPLGIKVVQLSGKLSAKERRQALEDTASGQAGVITGTHALVSDDVVFNKLALCIIDEQHRFGIDQRVLLLKKAPAGSSPHQLAMTATPIPRSLQLALYSDLDVSVIDEMPQGRTPTITAVISDDRIDEVIERVRVSLRSGAQIYWVCPRLEDEETLPGGMSAEERFLTLKKLLPEANIGLIHGRLAPNKKHGVMQQFLDNKISILVATTVIEVGVDVPNASIMIIEGSHLLGLAQLHQIRGRVGRGSRPSFCILLYNSQECSEIAAKRLAIMRATTDGFKIAAEDLNLRGPGDIVGEKQAGFDIFKTADTGRDFALIEPARFCAEQILKQRPELAAELIRRWFPQYL